MLNQLLNWRIDAERRRNRTRSVILLSLIVHMIVVMFIYSCQSTNSATSKRMLSLSICLTTKKLPESGA